MLRPYATNIFTQPLYKCKNCDERSKIILLIVSSLFLIILGIFLSLQIIPYGVNAITHTQTISSVLGWGLLGLGGGGLLLGIIISCRVNSKKFLTNRSSPKIANSISPVNTTVLTEKIISNLPDEPQATLKLPTPINLNLPNLDSERFQYSSNHVKEWNLCSDRLKCHFTDSIYGYIFIDEHELSNLDLQCQSFSNAQIIFNYQWRPDKDRDNNFPPKVLIDAFKIGKKLVLIELSTTTHSLLGVFSSDGSFKIIDSMLSGSKDCRKIADQLNAAHICTPDGKPIAFSGEYINTHIQKGGNACRNFVHLYAYQIAKTMDPNAFEEVNGAFLEGRLQVFEDYQKISGAPRVRTMQSREYSYESFMTSWAYRSLGWKENSWDELSLAQIFARLKPARNLRLDNIMYAHMVKSKFLPYFIPSRFPIPSTSQEINEITLNDPVLFEPVCLSEEMYHLPIKESLALDTNQYVLVWKNESKRLEIFRYKNL